MVRRLLLAMVSVCFSAYGEVWVPDLGNNYYKNPIIYSDYPSPDVVRVGSDYYMISGSQHEMPGIPVLHSIDLVNWTLIGHVFDALDFDGYRRPAFGRGVDSPSIAYRKGLFYVYFCTPDEGLFLATSVRAEGPWRVEHLIDVALWREPAPFWDDDGNAYLVRGEEGGEQLFLHRMSPDGKTLLDDGARFRFDQDSNIQFRGPKLFKRDGWYYSFATAGDERFRWQAALRSRRVYGPYEYRVVMNKGNTEVDGPQQGRFVTQDSGQSWFFHVHQKNVYGKVLHLQPMIWRNGWPRIGKDTDDDGVGEAVASWKKPQTATPSKVLTPQASDTFDQLRLQPQWQWQGRFKPQWYSLTAEAGHLRLFTVSNPSQSGNLHFVPNLLLQKFSAPQFTVTTRVSFSPKALHDKVGLVVMGEKWAYIALHRTKIGVRISVFSGHYQPNGDATVEHEGEHVRIAGGDTYTRYLRVSVARGGGYQFSYSEQGDQYKALGKPFKAYPGVNTGARVGLFALNPGMRESEGYADIDWFRVE